MRKVLLCFAVILMFACSKEKSKGWIVIDLDVVSLILEYSEKGSSSEAVKKELAIEMGTIEGELYAEVPVFKKDDDFVLKYKSDTYYMPFDADENTYIGYHKLEKTELNQLTIILDPITFSTELTLNNITCIDETDSMWIALYEKGDWSTETLYTGCIEEVLYKIKADTRILTDGNEFKVNIRTKKGGVEDSYVVNHVLLPEIVNELRLDY